VKAGFQNSHFGVNDLMKCTFKKNKTPQQNHTSYLLGQLSHSSLQAFYLFIYISSTTARTGRLKRKLE